MRTIPIMLTALLLGPSLSSAAVTELRNHYWGESQALPPTPVLTAPSSESSYLLAIALEDITCSLNQGKSGNFVTATIRWMDENETHRSYKTPSGGICTVSQLVPVRVHGGTAPTIETQQAIGCQTCLYNLFLDGFGFSALAEGQAGLAEPVQLQWLNQTKAQTLTLAGMSANLYLLSVLIVPHGTGGVNGVLTWWGDTGRNQAPATSFAGFIHASTGAASYPKLQVSGNVSQGYDVYVRAVTFGPPAPGPGPLTDYEYNLLDWTNATYPNLKTILTTGNQGANVVISSNIAERPNAGAVSEGLQVYWSNQTAVPCAAALSAGPLGVPARCASPALIAPNSPVQFRTYNTTGSPWGASPAYSTEVDVIVF